MEQKIRRENKEKLEKYGYLLHPILHEIKIKALNTSGKPKSEKCKCSVCRLQNLQISHGEDVSYILKHKPDSEISLYHQSLKSWDLGMEFYFHQCYDLAVKFWASSLFIHPVGVGGTDQVALIEVIKLGLIEIRIENPNNVYGMFLEAEIIRQIGYGTRNHQYILEYRRILDQMLLLIDKFTPREYDVLLSAKSQNLISLLSFDKVNETKFYKELQEVQKKALKLNPNNSSIILQMANEFYDQRKFKEASEYFLKYVNIAFLGDKYTMESYFRLASIHIDDSSLFTKYYELGLESEKETLKIYQAQYLNMESKTSLQMLIQTKQITKQTKQLTLQSSQNQKVCAVCKKKENLKSCSRCKKVHYCSVECQKKDWNTHKQDCKI